MFSKAKDHMVPIALFEVSSGSVAGAHALVRTDHRDSSPLVILSQSRLEASLGTEKDISQYVTDTLKRLESVISTVRAADTHQPVVVQLVLAAPWYTSHTRVITYKSESAVICSERLIDDLITQEIEKMRADETDQFGVLSADHDIVEKQISAITLNGYQTARPYGKKAQTIEVAVTVTMVPTAVLARFKDVITRSYGARRFAITTSTYAAYIVARDYLATADDCTIIDVGEEVTDVAFVKSGQFLYQHSFPIGSFALYRALSQNGGHTALEAKALLESVRSGKSSAGQAVAAAQQVFTGQWQNGLQQMIDGSQFGFCFPTECLLVADPRFGAFFVDSIKRDPFIQHVCVRGAVTPRMIYSEGIEAATRTLDGEPVDPTLAIAALFAERSLQ